MRLIKSAIFVASVLLSLGVQGMESSSQICAETPKAAGKLAFSFDLDDTLTGDYKLKQENTFQELETLPLIKIITSKKPKTKDKLERMFKDGRHVGYHYFVVKPMVAAIQELRKKGHIVIAATNQTYVYHCEEYSRILKERSNIDLAELFDAVLTTRYKMPSEPGEGLYYPINKNNKVYAMRDPMHLKPDVQYFEAVTHLIKTIDPTVTNIMHVDDLEQNIAGACNAGLDAFHFHLPAGKIMKSTPKAILDNVRKWKEALKDEYDIELTNKKDL